MGREKFKVGQIVNMRKEKYMDVKISVLLYPVRKIEGVDICPRGPFTIWVPNAEKNA